MMRIFRIDAHFLFGEGPPGQGWPGVSAKPTVQVRGPKPYVAYRNCDGAHVTRVTNARITRVQVRRRDPRHTPQGPAGSPCRPPHVFTRRPSWVLAMSASQTCSCRGSARARVRALWLCPAADSSPGSPGSG